MTALAAESLLAVFAVFCRVGGCLMVAPGFSSSYIPAKIRLFLALAISYSVSPLLLDDVRPALASGSSTDQLVLLVTELVTGILLGLLARLFYLALQTITVAMTQAVGLSPIPGTAEGEDMPVPALTALFTLTATTLIFISGLHIEMIRAIITSYEAIPPGFGLSPQAYLIDLVDQLVAAFIVALRIGSPFLIYSLVVNFALGLTNKLMPQLPVFFIGVPFVLIGGLFLLYMTADELILFFEQSVEAWILGIAG